MTINSIHTPLGEIQLFRADNGELYVKQNSLAKAMGYNKYLSLRSSRLGKLIASSNGLKQFADVGKPANAISLKVLVENILPAFLEGYFGTIHQSSSRAQFFGTPPSVIYHNAEAVLEILKIEYAKEKRTEVQPVQQSSQLRIIDGIKTATGHNIPVFYENGERFVKLRSIYNALGYPRSWNDNSVFSMAFKAGKIAYFTKYVSGGASYVIKEKDIVPLLEVFCRLTLNVTPTNAMHAEMNDNARMEAERLIEAVNLRLFGKKSTCTVLKTETSKAEITPTEIVAKAFGVRDIQKEDTQMETNDTIQAAVPPVTTADIQEIGERAEATVKIFGVSKTDALRAVTQLKAQEINRDLSPLLELLK